MSNFCSFLQTVYHFVKSLVVNVTKKMYRTAIVLTSGLTVVTVVAFSSSSFAGTGKSAAAAFHESEDGETERLDVLQSEEEGEGGVFADVQLKTSNEESQRLIGSLLEKNIQDNLAKAALEIEVIEKEVLMQAQQAREEEAKRARKERQRLKREQAVIPYTDSDYEVLKRIVQAEAGICDEKGKILVANVIINRVKSSEFPDNITDVVYQRSQFSPVSDGSIRTCKVTQQTIDCVDRALAGEDYSRGALYFMNRGGSAASNVRWFDGRLTFVMQHERHEFFKSMNGSINGQAGETKERETIAADASPAVLAYREAVSGFVEARNTLLAWPSWVVTKRLSDAALPLSERVNRDKR